LQSTTTALASLVDFLNALIDLTQRLDETITAPSQEIKKRAKKMKFKSLMKTSSWAGKKILESQAKKPLKRRLSMIALYLGLGVS
jgi:hypothetical protein